MAKLKADTLSLVTSKPGDPIRFTDYRKGDDVPGLDPEREAELIAAGALEDPNARAAGVPGDSQPPGDSQAPGKDGTEPDTRDYRTEPDTTDTPRGTGSTVGVLTADEAGELKGAELTQALEARGLSTSGSVAEKQSRLVAAVS